MKRIFTILAAVCMAASMMAETYPTKFLGIPIDGTKEEMIRKIQAKGFTLHREYGQEYLSGEFNGSEVHIYVATNNNKVYRIMVSDQKMCTEGQIRISFNNLMQQFQDNSKYLPYVIGQTFIPIEEDISYEMTVKSKLYDAKFVQITHEADTSILQQDMLNVLQDIPTSLLQELEPDVLANYCFANACIKQYEKNMVWFRIYEYKGEYYLTIYYDNLYNKANGEDL